jgi:hypothetical protein
MINTGSTWQAVMMDLCEVKKRASGKRKSEKVPLSEMELPTFGSEVNETTYSTSTATLPLQLWAKVWAILTLLTQAFS